jgi:hypothetical protein
MKGRKHRETGGTNEAEEDEKTKPEARTDAKKIDAEAEELKKGGRAKRKRGGKTEVGKVEGHEPMHHAGRKPRKSGGRSTSDANPFTSARKGEDAPGRKVMKGELGFGED